MQRLKHLIVALAITFSGGLLLAPAMVSADFKSDACQGANEVVGSSSSDCSNDSGSLNNILRWVLDVFSAIVGFVAVIMVIVGGLKLITSSGDSSNITSGRNTIYYALIGLVIVALAQVIVHFVLAKVAKVSVSR